MIREGKEEKEDNEKSTYLAFKDVLILAIATSIDALAVGVSFAFLKVNLLKLYSPLVAQPLFFPSSVFYLERNKGCATIIGLASRGLLL